jgi:chemotaxis methyl-accepting protein methylase
VKIDLIEIGIKDLRDFTIYSDQYLATSFKNFSISSLKLRLQFLIFQNKFKNFESLFNYYKAEEKFQEKIIDTIFPQSNELLRDSTCFSCFFNTLQSIKAKDLMEICIFEFGNYAETVSLLIFLMNRNYLDKVRITIVDLTSRKKLPSHFGFTQREMDIGEINYTALNERKSFVEFFVKMDKVYEYIVPSAAQIFYKKLSEIANMEIKFDAIISRNLTLHYNFHAHQNIFLSYVNFLKKNGILFVGTNERFDWCTGIEELIKPDKLKPLYIKK